MLLYYQVRKGDAARQIGQPKTMELIQGIRKKVFETEMERERELKSWGIKDKDDAFLGLIGFDSIK